MNSPTPQRLVAANELLATIWPNESSRPSLRWLRDMTRKGAIPYIKIGHKVFFEPEQTMKFIIEWHSVTVRDA